LKLIKFFKFNSEKIFMRKFFTPIFVLSFLVAGAQDIHFSQHWAAPISMNPAFTGKFGGLIRGTFNYRNQWFTIPTLNSSTPYQTIQASVDAQVLPTSRGGNNRLGVGGAFFNDKAGDGALQTNSGMVSVAYHQSVSRYGNSHISFGIQAGVVSKRINFENLIFENQLNGNFGWNPSSPNGEPVAGRSALYPDVNIGVMFSSRPKPNIAYNIGYAMHHVARPRETFLGQDNYVERRHVVNGAIEISAGYENEWTVSPVFLFMMQANATLYHVGLGVNYQTQNPNLAIFGGGFYRVLDAAILNVGIELFNARVGVSYDINHSELRGASRAQGALELSLVYVFRKQGDQILDNVNFCPKFL
jgi:type IX secretion system PorP/SprF family membrane protein